MVYFWQRQPRSSSRSMASTNISSTTSTNRSSTLSSTPSSSSPTSLSSRQISSLTRDNGRRKSRGTEIQTEVGDASALIQDGSLSGFSAMGNHETNNSNNNNSHNQSVVTNKTQHSSRPFTGVFVLNKLVEFSRRKQETDRRKVAEKELDSLNMKINKLLSKMGEAEGDNPGRMKMDEECVVCLAAPATMQTFPCGHKVVCRKCLIKTIQVAVSQRCLPLRCVICRDRILKLHHALHQPCPDDGETQQQQYGTHVVPSSLTAGVLSSPPQVVLTSCSGVVNEGLAVQNFPTSPSKMFSFLTSSTNTTKHSGGTSSKPLSPTATLHFPTSPRHHNHHHHNHHHHHHHNHHGAEKNPGMAHSTEEFPSRYSPSNLEAFLYSHNDALNLHPSETSKKTHSSPENKKTEASHDGTTKHHHQHQHHHSSSQQQQQQQHPKRQESQCLGFMNSQSVKIHPEAQKQICAFMDSTDADQVVPPVGPVSGSSRSAKANKFIARFLPRAGIRRKHVRSRQE